MEVYVRVDGRVYQVNVYSERVGEEGLDDGDLQLLSTLRFERPARSARSVGLPDGGRPEAYYAEGKDDLTTREEAARRGTTAAGETAPSGQRTTSSGYGERKISEGCWLAPSGFYFQTQHGRYANRFANDAGTDAPQATLSWASLITGDSTRTAP